MGNRESEEEREEEHRGKSMLERRDEREAMEEGIKRMRDHMRRKANYERGTERTDGQIAQRERRE